MSKSDEQIRIGLILLLSLSILVLFVDMLNILSVYNTYFKKYIFFSAMIFIAYFLIKSRLDQALTYIIICVLFNPYYPIHLDNPIWHILEFPVLCLFIHRMYFLVFENQLKAIDHDAAKLDQYFKELERNISSLSYHQITLYIKNRHTENYHFNEEGISWTISEIPFAEFEILREFYTLGANSKGGVNIKMIHTYHNIEIHLNFNLTANVKYTVIEGKFPNRPNRLARHLKNVLVHQYHYLEL